MASVTTSAFDLSVGGQRGERGHDDVGRVGLEVAAQRLAGVAAPEPVGAERCEAAAFGDPPGDLVGDGLHEVGDRDHRARHRRAAR